MVATLLMLVLVFGMFFVSGLRQQSEKTIDARPQLPLTRFIYDQGYTLNVISYAVYLRDEVPAPMYGSYLLTPALNRLACGLPVNRIVSSACVSFEKPQDAASAGYGTSYVLTEKIIGEKSLSDGFGVDSSYIIDLYYDLGWIGVAMGSILLGIFFSYMHALYNRKKVFAYLVMLSLFSLFIIGRTTVANWLGPLLYVAPYMVVGSLYVISVIYVRFLIQKRRIVR